MERRKSKRPLGYLNHLLGKILYCHSIEPAFGNAAMAALREALAPNRELLEIAIAFEPTGAIVDLLHLQSLKAQVVGEQLAQFAIFVTNEYPGHRQIRCF